MAGRFSTTAPPGKPTSPVLKERGGGRPGPCPRCSPSLPSPSPLTSSSHPSPLQPRHQDPVFWLFSVLKGPDLHASQGCLSTSLKIGSSVWVQAREDLAAAPACFPQAPKHCREKPLWDRTKPAPASDSPLPASFLQQTFSESGLAECWCWGHSVERDSASPQGLWSHAQVIGV